MHCSLLQVFFYFQYECGGKPANYATKKLLHKIAPCYSVIFSLTSHGEARFHTSSLFSYDQFEVIRLSQYKKR